MSAVSSFVSALLLIAVVELVARFILSRWLFDRPLVIACTACGITAGVVRYSYSGPTGSELLGSLAGLAGTAVAALIICSVRLRRLAREESR